MSIEKFIPKTFEVFQLHFIDAELPDEHYKHQKENARNMDKLSFFVSTIDAGTKNYQNRMNTASAWAKTSTFINNTQSTVQNTPMSGYKFIDTARRYRTNNALFRMMHPHGYIFEISVENALEIIELCKIEKGVILDELYLDKDKFLMNNSFEKYSTFETKIKSEVQSSVLKEGDICEISLKDLAKGTWCYSTEEGTTHMMYLGSKHTFALGNKSTAKAHIFKNSKDELLFCSDASLKSSLKGVVQGTNEVFSPDKSLQFINDCIYTAKVINAPFKYVNAESVVLCNDKPFKATDLVPFLTKCTDSTCYYRAVIKEHGYVSKVHVGVGLICYIIPYDGTYNDFIEHKYYRPQNKHPCTYEQLVLAGKAFIQNFKL